MREEFVMTLHLPIGSLNSCSQYGDANTVSSSTLADNLATVPSGPVLLRWFDPTTLASQVSALPTKLILPPK